MVTHRFAVLEEDGVLLMGRDLMTRAQLSLIYKNSNYYEAQFGSTNKRKILKIYRILDKPNKKILLVARGSNRICDRMRATPKSPEIKKILIK